MGECTDCHREPGVEAVFCTASADQPTAGIPIRNVVLAVNESWHRSKATTETDQSEDCVRRESKPHGAEAVC